jgi:bifunctional non-homologous end joining protein LigD
MGDCFIQKRPPQGMPSAVERLDIPGSDGVEQHLAIHDLEGLLWLVQFGTLEIHVWGARASDVDRPDRMVFDLDPDPAVGWPEVVDTARVVRDLLAELKLESFVKTTGGKGLHVVVPLARRHSWSEVKSFAKGVADLLVATAPTRYVATSSKAARRGKLFVDYLRNDRGSLAVAAYSTRARAGAPVSTPVSWEELGSLTSGADFTLANLPRRLARLRRDPWEGISQLSQTIRAASRKRLERAGV